MLPLTSLSDARSGTAAVVVIERGLAAPHFIHVVGNFWDFYSGALRCTHSAMAKARRAMWQCSFGIDVVLNCFPRHQPATTREASETNGA